MVKTVLNISIFFFIVFIVIFSAPVYIQGTENKIESLIKFEKTVTVKDMAAVGEPMDKQCKTAEESKDPDKINPCRDDAQKNAIEKLEKIALNRAFDSLKQDGFLEEKFLKELGMTEQDIRSESNFEAKTSEKEVIETKSYRCTLQGIVKVKISASFKEKLLKIADKSKYYTESKAKAVKSEDHTKQTVSKTPDSVKQESSDISRSDYTEPKTRMEFVFVKGGDFEMGGNKVRIDDFYMGKYEVTNAQFMKFRPDHYEKRNKPYSSDKDKHPVIDVTWNDAEEFAKWLSDKGEKFRLPTEAEWEYAARAGAKTKYLWGDKSEDACKYANVRECNKQGSISVGGLTPNNFGLYDMAGNVWEWMNDEAVKGSPDSDRVMRGGSYKDFAERVTNSVRDQAMPDTEKPNLGFRLIRENKPSKK